MEIQHRDRNGKFWRFRIDCTPEQADAIRAALACVRNMGRGPALSLANLKSDAENGPLYAAIEAALLRGLADAFPLTPPRQDPPPTHERREAPADPPPTPSQPQPYAAEIPGTLRVVETDERPGYWWERF